MTAPLITILLALAVECSAASAQLDCTFETDFCQWTKDQGTDKFDWNLIPWAAQAGKGPNGDHTTGHGHYVHVGSAVGANGDNAQLISPLLAITSGQSKCLVFFYTMYGEHVNNLNVYGKTHTTRHRIWTRHGNQGTDWIEARIHLEEATDFQVVIEAVRGDGEKGDIFIDDINIIDGPCSSQVMSTKGKIPPATTTTTKPTSTSTRNSTTSVPPSSIHVTCSFDIDMCSWTQMKNDVFDWTRRQGSTYLASSTGPLFDHTTGKGYYLYTEVSGQTANKTARIQSKTITPRLVTQCLSFWYHMHGDHIGRLNVYIKSTPTIGSPIWTKTGAQGLTWKQADITVSKGHTPYSVVIEAVTAGGSNGGIAIDDALLSDNACRGTVRPTVHTIVHPGQVVRKCDFEAKSICGYNQDVTDTFDWTWASHMARNGSGTSIDHTYGTSSGHYLSIEGSSRKTGDIARILSPTYHDSQTMCVTFYYHMYGSSVGTLNVYVKVGNLQGRLLFSRSGTQGSNWSVGQATIPGHSGISGYRMVFEGTVGSSYESDIALDDVSFTMGACPLPGDCNFESGPCTWANTGSGDQFDWMMGSGSTPSYSTGPSRDHTLCTEQGRYLYIETSAQRRPGDKAWLISESFPPTPSGTCISFWYSMYGATVDSLNVYIRVPGRTDKMIWKQSGNHSNYWLNGRAPINERFSSYTIVIEGIRGFGYTGDIAIDDISITRSNCALIPPNAAPVPQTTAEVTTQSVGKTAFSCNFQIDFCGWSQIKGTDLSDWNRQHGTTSGADPSTDHTLGNSNGYYLLTETSSDSGKTRNKARLFSPRVQAGQSCITFWYNMYGSNVVALNVYVQTGSAIPSTPTWKRTGTQGTHWRMGQISLNAKTPFNVVIEAVTAGGSNGGIAIDDALLSDNACRGTVRPTVHTIVHPGQVVRKCDFEYTSICGYNQDVTDTFDWTWVSHMARNGSGTSTDHTYGTSSGHYLSIEGSSRKTGDIARILSPTYHDSQTMCVTFYYHMYGSSVGTLNVYVKVGNLQGRLLFSRSGNQGSNWSVGQATIPGHSGISGYRMVFEGTVGSSYESDIALDDVSFTVGACPPPGDCNFESGLCTWANTGSGDQFDWMMGSGSTPSYSTGPSRDHTVGTGQGRYLYIETSAKGRPGDKAWLISESFPPSPSGTCISFWYSMYGATVDSLNVYIRVPGRTDKMIWKQSGNHSNYWLNGRAPINERFSSYTIVIEGIRGFGYTGDIAIDDISITRSNCALIPPNAAPVPQTTAEVTTQSVGKTAFSCNFQIDFCGWSQIKGTDLSDWNRQHGTTSGADPSIDHTLGNSNGYYILTETSSDSGKTRNKARLFSPRVQADQSCITFWYNMYGSNVVALNVYVQTGAAIPSTPTWKRTGTQGTHWRMGQISLNAKTPFNVVIDGVSGDHHGVVAIDDVSIANGPCSAGCFVKTEPGCSRSVDFELICTSIKDTPDVVGGGKALLPTGATVGPSSKPSDDKCNFEDTNLCGFSQDHSDDFDWFRNAGSTGSVGTGPANDHTYGTTSGHYMYIETSAKHPNDVARLNSFILSGHTSPTCLTFWYHMYGSTIGTLNVYAMKNGARGSPIWHLSGNQGNAWKVAEVSVKTVPSNTSYQIVFEGIVGRSYEGDIAIDDLSVTSGACSSGGTTVHPSSKPDADQCSFENSIMCGFSQELSDDFDWTRHAGLTASSGTGPTNDHTLRTTSGYYMYIETSAPRRPNDVARLNSFILSGPTSPACLTFWYHMYGTSIGTLNVYVMRNGARGSPIWYLSGNQGNAWKEAKVSLNTAPSNMSYHIVFEGIVGAGYEGDIAIDDFSVKTDTCSSVIPSAARPTMTEKPTTMTAQQSTKGTKPSPKPTGTTVHPASKPAADKCSFEKSIMCGFSQDHSDDFDWSRHAGSTASVGTGPANDHTYGTGLSYYMYIETSAKRPNDVARLNSFILSGPTSPTCLTFWYHMYGSSTGTLNVYVVKNGVRGSPIWHLSGNQGNAWKVAKVSLNTAPSNMSYHIVFEGIVGAGYEGDIAIDDFSVTTDTCSSGVIPNADRPTVTEKPTTMTAPQSTKGTKPTPTGI